MNEELSRARVERLIKDAINGDQYAFEVLIRGHLKLVTTIMKAYVKNEEDLKESVQDVFLEVWKYLRTYDPQKGNFSTWVGKITRNVASHYYKLKQKEENNDAAYRQQFAMIMNSETYYDDYIKKDDKSPAISIQDNFKTLFNTCLFKDIISSEEYDILMLKYFYKLTDEEICKTVGMKSAKHARRAVIRVENKVLSQISKFKVDE